MVLLAGRERLELVAQGTPRVQLVADRAGYGHTQFAAQCEAQLRRHQAQSLSENAAQQMASLVRCTTQ